jgi:hypothetical protein
MQMITYLNRIKMIEYENLGKLNQSFFGEYREAFDRVMQSGWYILGTSVNNLKKIFAVTAIQLIAAE